MKKILVLFIFIAMIVFVGIPKVNAADLAVKKGGSVKITYQPYKLTPGDILKGYTKVRYSYGCDSYYLSPKYNISTVDSKPVLTVTYTDIVIFFINYNYKGNSNNLNQTATIGIYCQVRADLYSFDNYKTSVIIAKEHFYTATPATIKNGVYQK